MLHALIVVAVLSQNPGSLAAGPGTVSGWAEVDKQISEQKFQKALELTEKRLEAAAKGSDDAEHARALVKRTQLRIGLGGYETAVKELKAAKWPGGTFGRAVVQLYYAHAIARYRDSYSWEIRQREKIDTKGEVDLKAWTMEQLNAELHRAYGEVWKLRAELGKRPLGDFKEYISANSYPKGIRDTARDAVGWMWGDQIVNTGQWTAEQSNSIYQQNLEALIKGDAGAAGRLDLSDLNLHPVVRLTAVYDDLEAWHLSAGRKEAALAARFEKFEKLFQVFTDDRDRERLRAALEAELTRSASLPYVSMGHAQLAEWWRQSGSLKKAHQVASAGAQAHPQHVGGRRCRYIVAQLEAPDFNLQSMETDGPRQRSIQVSHKNLGKLWFRAYRLDFKAWLSGRTDYQLMPSSDEMRGQLRNKATAQWVQELPATPDFQSHLTWVTPPLEQPGLYMVIASAKSDFADSSNRMVGVNLVISNLAMLVKNNQGQIDAIVVEGQSGKPVQGATVELWGFRYNAPRTKGAERKTGADGSARFDAKDATQDRSYFLLASRGPDVVFEQQGISFYRSSSPAPSASLVFTDRSVYRPTQKLLWKVVAYSGNSERTQYETRPNQKLTVQLFDPNYQVVESREVTTNKFGSAAGEFVIPTGRLLGQWHVQVSGGGQSYVKVEEYKRPTFEVSFKDTGTALRLNQPATLTGEARYYFGLPVTSGNVKWRVQRTPVYPPWFWWWWGYSPPARTQVIASGVASLKPDGTFEVPFKPEADPKLQREVSYRYQVDADVTDEGGETRSAAKTTRLGFVSVEARATLEGNFVPDGAAAAFELFRGDLDGNPRAGKGAWKVVALQQPAAPLMPGDEPIARTPLDEKNDTFKTLGDAQRPRWSGSYGTGMGMRGWKEGAEVQKGEATHDAQGKSALTVGRLGPGAYRLVYETKDDAGEVAKAFADFIVAGPSFNLALPLELKLEKPSVKAGETARFLLGSGFKGQAMLYEVYRGHQRIERKWIKGGDAALISRPVTAEDRGGFSVQVTLLRDWQLVQQSAHVYVPWDDKELQLEFSTFRDQLKPGGKETFRVSVKGKAKALESGAAEVLAYMYDRSLDVFGPHAPPMPLSLYASRQGLPGLQSTQNSTGAQWLSHNEWYSLPNYPALNEDGLHFPDDYGIGGLGMRGFGPGGGGHGIMALEGAPPPSPSSAPAPLRGRSAKDEAAPDTGALEKKKSANFAQALSYEGDDRADGSPRGGEAPVVQVRQNFAETAFWVPQLITDAQGGVAFDFTVPDSVTSWNVWAHAITRDLRSGSVSKQTKSVKELMVRPYVPRFLREGDQASLKVVINNASKKDLQGELKLDLFDPDTQQDVAKELQLQPTGPQPFTVKAGEGATLTYTLVAPKRVGMIAFKAIAKTADFSDGEQRPVPLLPSRLHLAQSKFVTLKGKDSRTMTFADLKNASSDPSLINEQLVVTVDAQLFFTVLQALPYLMRYPYECTEQTLNRFLSAGIVGSVFRDHPAVAKMAAKFAARTTPLETFDQVDPNRKIALEETPWLLEAKGGKHPASDAEWLNLLDPKVVQAESASALSKLRKAQYPNGGFPWFPGGPPSPYLTLYLLQGFSRAAEFKVELPRDMVLRAWQAVAVEYRGDLQRCMRENGCWELVTMINFVASSFPDESWLGGAFSSEERRTMLDYSFRHWKRHSPMLKSYLALTLKRFKRDADARLVFDSVMDSSKTTQDEGTFWAPEDRSWLWYNDTIESHATALRTLMELSPKDSRREGLVQWLLLNKKLNQWKSTRATSEVIYSLTKYLQAEKQLGIREESLIQIGSRETRLEFLPDEYTGKKNQIVVPGPEIDPPTMSTVKVSKSTPGIQFASTTWHFSTEQLPKEARGDLFQVTRTYFRREKLGKEVTLQPLSDGAKLSPGDELEVHLSMRAKAAAEYVHLKDPRGAGFEPDAAVSKFKWNLGLGWYEEYRDSGTNFFFEKVPVGEFTFKYRVRAAMGGTFRVGPAQVQSMYAPEFVAYSQGHVLSIATGGK